ncbi:uncharacterized protein C20orf96 homolog isoform X2 [Lepus europaeus]|uniref:uncharacterized protein C20orf96 homolog isoform X2 n=1 Tax=Lepus europaeus TaxID=9983 RepID=UPI002B4A97F3|nr:uncharacterized protein C20orf96 homolog isoform X2 [Lepus europaeus]
MMEVLSRPNSLQTQPLRDFLHRPQVPGSVVQAEGQAAYSASTPASRRWGLQQKQTEDFHVAPQAHHRGDAPPEEPRGPIREGDGRRREDPGANPADQGDAQEPAGHAPGARQPRALPRQAQRRAAEDDPGRGGQHGADRAGAAASAGHAGGLERQVQHLDAQNKKTQDQVNFLSTYMDHEYPVKLVQLASLGRQVQQAKDRQQDELDDFSELRRKVLASVCAKIQEKKRRILRAVAVKTQRPHQEALLRKMQESQFMQKFAWRFRDVRGQAWPWAPWEGAAGQPGARGSQASLCQCLWYHLALVLAQVPLISQCPPPPACPSPPTRPTYPHCRPTSPSPGPPFAVTPLRSLPPTISSFSAPAWGPGPSPQEGPPVWPQ